LDFNLAQNAGGEQVNTIEKVTPIEPNRARMADGGRFVGREMGEHHTPHTGSTMQIRCQKEAPTDLSCPLLRSARVACGGSGTGNDELKERYMNVWLLCTKEKI